MTTWEYKIINIRSENYRLDPNAAPQLNTLGAEGWELISITSASAGFALAAGRRKRKKRRKD